jgi:hypothetical protein
MLIFDIGVIRKIVIHSAISGLGDIVLMVRVPFLDSSAIYRLGYDSPPEVDV